MKRISILAIVSCLVTVLVVLFSTKSLAFHEVSRARAIVQGSPGSGVSGQILFRQFGTGFISTVQVTGLVEGLPPNTKHGFHIHENGTCSPDFLAAGGHFDPGPNGNSTPVDNNHPYHSGDLPNITADSRGIAALDRTTSRVTLSPGPVSLFDQNGSSVIVHANEDLGTTGVTGSSGGPRLACGVIMSINRRQR